MSVTSPYGKLYYCIKVTSDLARDGEIYVRADEVSSTLDGALQIQAKGQDDDAAPLLTLLLPAGKWLAVYAASAIDGSAVAVDHWEGEVVTYYGDFSDVVA